MLSISLSCCIVLTRASSTTLSRQGESKHLCLVPCLWESNNCAQMQVRLQFTRFFFLFYYTKSKKDSYFVFPCLPCGILLQGIWLFLSLHSTFLMDDLTHVYFEHFKLGKVNSSVSFPPPTHPSLG